MYCKQSAVTKMLYLLSMMFLMVSCSSNSSNFPDDGFDNNPNENLESANLYVVETEMAVQMVDEGLSVNIPIHQKSARDTDITMSATLIDLDGEEISTKALDLSISEKLQDMSIVLGNIPEEFVTDSKGKYLVRFDIKWKDGEIWGTRSVHTLYRYVQAQLLGAKNLYESGNSFYKLLVSEPNSGNPIESADAEFYLTREGQDDILVGSGTTDSFGMADVKISLPSDLIGDANLKALINLPNGEQQEQAIAPVVVERDAKILLTTDKPMYQPGQTINMRALALKRPDLLPQADLPVLFTVMDPKGNKVFKEELLSSEYGVSSATFKLASLVNEGHYTIQAQVGEDVTEKTVTVERYSLPKFSVNFTTDKNYYKPGEKVVGKVNADYFFGKKVAGDVEVKAYKFDVEMEEFTNVQGQLDSNGEFSFDVDLPSYFVASALDENKAYAFFEISVTDTAAHTQVKSAQVLVVQNSILLSMVPESGSLVPDVENLFYIISTDPFGRPLDADCDIKIGDDSQSVETGSFGLATFNYTPQTESLEVEADCSINSGDSVKQSFTFASENNREYVLVRTDKATYKVGDSVKLSIFATNDGWDAAHLPDRVYLDVIKNGQTMLMTTVPLTDGKGSYDLDLDSTLTGSIELMGYYLGAASEIIRDRKLLFVELENALTVEITPNKETFKPAEEASIALKVKDNTDTGVQSVVGVQVVDEAVFALQDMKPGMEKIYFQLEEELLQPRYEIHGFDAREILESEPEDPQEKEERDAYAGAFLASAGTDSAYGVNVNTFSGVDATAIQTASARVKKDLDSFVDHIEWMIDSGFISGENGIKAWVELKNSNEDPLYDPWGQKYVLSYKNNAFEVASNGMDEKAGNDDDIKLSSSVYSTTTDGDMWDDNAVEDEGGMDGGIGGRDEPTVDGDEAVDGDAETTPSSGDEEGDGPRVRSYFPETLYVNPSVITDANGEATVEFAMADSITSWRMTTLASSLQGQIGSNVGNVIVFQDFFVDIDFPATLTQNDIVEVPIAIYNYMSEAQTIELTASADSDWLEFLDGTTRTIEDLAPNSVTGIYFPVKVKTVGVHSFTVTGIGTKESDAIRRNIEVVPDGLEVRNAASGRLEETQNVTVNIPEGVVENASKMWVKIYPGLFSQAVEGLDSMLNMPCGCFEQTSSSTYPNILVLDYMILTEQTSPEIELKARDYISQGYQRLLSYEVDGGGFEWFGSPPAHRALTAYGLLEFYDMSKVHDVDEAIITRTQSWLTSLMNSDGSYDFDAGGIHEGATNNFTNSVLRNTAYITYALAESGYTGSEVAKSVAWVKSHLDEADDNYSKALVAMLLAVADPNSSQLTQVLDDIYESRTEDEKGAIHWGQEAPTEMYGSGNSANLETTALIGQAFIRANYKLNAVGGIMDWILSQKGSFGEWSTTQGTIQALRFMIASLGSDVEEADATVVITANGTEAYTVTVDPAHSDVLQLRDLTSYLTTGDNTVSLSITGEGNLMYSVVSSYWVPSSEDPYDGQGEGALSIDISYDKTTLQVDDIVTATATVTNNTDAVAKMVLVDIGMPPGFELIADQLQTAISETALQRYELAGRQLILYIERIEPGTPLVLTYQLKANFPMEGSSGPASVSNYYEPENKTNTEPQMFVVTE